MSQIAGYSMMAIALVFLIVGMKLYRDAQESGTFRYLEGLLVGGRDCSRGECLLHGQLGNLPLLHGLLIYAAIYRKPASLGSSSRSDGSCNWNNWKCNLVSKPSGTRVSRFERELLSWRCSPWARW